MLRTSLRNGPLIKQSCRPQTRNGAMALAFLPVVFVSVLSVCACTEELGNTHDASQHLARPTFGARGSEGRR
jgi:hypothetical protein